MKKILFILFIHLLNSCSVSSQSFNCIAKFNDLLQDSVYMHVSTLPTLIDKEGYDITSYILKNINFTQQEELQFTVACSFVITKHGLPTLIEIRNKDEKEYTYLEQQIIRLVSETRWNSGKCGKKTVATHMFLPIYLSYQ